MSGVGVNDYTGDDYPDIIYLSDYEAQNVPLESLYELDGKEYRMVGYGFIVPANFTRIISRSSPQRVFDYPTQAVYVGISDEDTSRWFRVIPYDAFREAYEPDLVLIHFPDLNYGQMLRMTDRLAKMYPSSTVTPPTANANERFQQAMGRMRLYIPLYVVLSEITVVLAICELYRRLRAESYIIRACGVSRRKLKRYLSTEIVLLYILGTGIALLLQICLKGFLSGLGVSVLPTVMEITAIALISCILSILLSLPGLIKSLQLQRFGEE